MTHAPGEPPDLDDATTRALWRSVRPAAFEIGAADEAASLAAWIEGRLPEAEAAGIEARLAADPELLDLALSLQAVGAAPASLPGGLRRRVESLLPSAPAPAGARSLSWLPRAIAASVLAALILGSAGGGFLAGRSMAESATAVGVLDEAVGVDPLGVLREEEP